MLTRKQRWRRVRPGKRTDGKAAAGTFAVRDTSAHPPRPTIPSVGASADPTEGARGGGDSPTPSAGAASGTTDDVCSSTSRNSDAAHAPRIRFNHLVRVILVPCARELRDLSAQLWWGEDDYRSFRRDYVIAVRSAAAEAARQREEKLQSRPEQATRAPVSTAAAPAEAKVLARLSTKLDVQAIARPVVPPSSSSPPFPDASKSCTTKSSDISLKAAAAAAAASKATATAVAGIESGGGSSTSVPAAEARELPKPATASQPPPSAAFAPKEGTTNGRDREMEGDKASPFSGIPPRWPSASSRQTWRPMGPRLWTAYKWTPSAGAAAAKAAADDDEDGYRTHSMSSVSDSTEDGYDW